MPWLRWGIACLSYSVLSGESLQCMCSKIDDEAA